MYVNITIKFYYFVALTVQFSSRSYTASESSGNISVTLSLEGGTSSSNITVIVLPSDQSPVSAEGNKYVFYIDWFIIFDY